MSRWNRLLNVGWLLAAMGTLAFSANMPVRAAASGPLRPHPHNPRYFADLAGRTVWLTGSHTWANFQERGIEGKTPDFDFDRYLDFLQRHGHNFIRLWAWEHAQWMQFAGKDVPIRYKPLPYPRTGPGTALDGGPKFDLSQFNEQYFRRLRQRVEKANRRGMYVGVMLFQGFSLDKRRGRRNAGNAWLGHPFHRDNNINGVDGNPSGDNSGHEVHELKVPEITRLQEAYVRKVIDTLGDLDNVLWEIGNECHTESVAWQYHMIRFIKQYEAARAKQHPVGMTGAPIRAKPLLAGPADWISPPGKTWLLDPPVNSGKKVILVDTDHCDPWHHSPQWVWKNFFRGNQFILMDGYMDFRLGSPPKPDPNWNITRQTMGLARQLAEQIDLARFTPQPELASSGYCLACLPHGSEYLVYLPEENEVTLDLSGTAGTLAVRWIDGSTGKAKLGQTVEGGAKRRLRSPFDSHAIAHLFAPSK